MRTIVLSMCALVLAGHTAVHAQSIRGTLIDQSSNEPIPRGSIALLNSAAIPIDSTLTNERGQFAFRVPAAGQYWLYFSQRGYASVPSDRIRLGRADAIDIAFRVPLISIAAMQRMAETIQLEHRLQTDYAEMCGEALAPRGTGIVVGVVRRWPGGEPLPGAIIRAESPVRDASPALVGATVSGSNGLYVLCNLPAGQLTSRTHAAGYRIDHGPITIRAGEVAWYDVFMRVR